MNEINLPTMAFQCLTSARGSLYYCQLLCDGQLESFHLRLVQPQLLHFWPGLCLKGVKPQHTIGMAPMLIVRFSDGR